MKAPGGGAGKRRVWGQRVFWRNDPGEAGRWESPRWIWGWRTDRRKTAAAAAAAAAAVAAARVLAARRKRAAADAEDISRWETNGGA